jgi:hypothetical protein
VCVLIPPQLERLLEINCTLGKRLVGTSFALAYLAWLLGIIAIIFLLVLLVRTTLYQTPINTFRFIILFTGVLFCLFLQEALLCGYSCYYPHFMDRTLRDREVKKLVHITLLGSGRVRVCTQVCLVQKLKFTQVCHSASLWRRRTVLPGGVHGQLRGLKSGRKGEPKLWGGDKCVLSCLTTGC